MKQYFTHPQGWDLVEAQISNEICPFLVRAMGLEPIRDYHTPFKRARLPIPPRLQTMLSLSCDGSHYSKGYFVSSGF